MMSARIGYRFWYHHRNHQYLQVLRHNSFFKRVKNEMEAKNPFAPFDVGITENRPPDEVDIVVVGGGVIGSSVAYFLKTLVSTGMRVLVVDKDPTYTRSSSLLSLGGIHQQFSIPENIQMSLYSAHFLRNIKEKLMVDGIDPPDIHFNPQGHLFLATEEGAETLIDNCSIQSKFGAKSVLMSQTQLKKKFPWLNTDGIELGRYGIENEGWFDPGRLLQAFKRKAISMGVYYVHGEVTGFKVKHQAIAKEESYVPDYDTRIERVEITMPNSPEVITVPCAIVVNAAGPEAADLARLLYIGSGEGEMAVPLPVEPRKRFAFVINSLNGPGLECPVLVDPSGMCFRRDGLGGNFICSMEPGEEEEPSTGTLNVDYDWFNRKVLPSLTHRVPALKNAKMHHAWATFIDYNTVDQNPIVSRHPVIPNFFFANGLSGNALQHAPAIGRAMSELLVEGAFVNIDLAVFDFYRFVVEKQILERKVV
ncbi:FAD-dependent oxidoreductase domain-containing protein 1-like [Ptychodera flava]|uniref:FAD-dependent oxidoreductase domain-containing protein 1-like n=1 Tax=Ptychodera flava TaxID=63121 RepID=UPI00396AA95B